MRYLFKSVFTRQEKRRFYLLTFGMILSGLMEVVSIASIMPFLAVAANPDLIQKNPYLNFISATLQLTDSREFLLFLGFALIIVILFSNIVNAFLTWMNLQFTWAINHSLSVRLMERYMALSYISFITRNSSDMQMNIQSEIMAFANNVINSVLSIISKGISLLMIVILLILVDPFLVVCVAAIFTVIYSAIYAVSKKTLTVIGQGSLQDNESKFRALSEALGVFKIAKLLHLEDFFVSRFATASYSFSFNQSKRMAISQLPRFAVETVSFTIMVGISLYIIGAKPSFAAAIPVLGLYAFAAYRILPGMQQLYTSFSILRSWWPNVEHLSREFENIGVPDTPSAAADNETAPTFEKNRAIPLVELQNVSFSYLKNRRIIDNISLSIPKACTVGFFGETGSGKTTIIDLIMGILRPDHGRIVINGHAMFSENIESWQKSIGYVPQDIYLTDSSIAKNVAFGAAEDKIDFEQVRRACALANIAEFIEKELFEKYNTVVGERGVRMSGGQRQRIGIARALYYDPEVLIFDEATSALDNETEKILMEAIDSFAHNKTIILIAHRLSTLQKCDLVFKLDRGKIAKSGKFKEVVELT